ncbi:MAG: polysaccharide deacetylase family protein [Tissierellales bacterium]
MKKLLVFMLIIALTSNLTLANKSLGISFNSVELSILTETTPDPSNSEFTEEPNEEEKEEENAINPIGNNSTNESTNSELANSEKPNIGGPYTEYPESSTTTNETDPTITDIHAEPIEVEPLLIDTLNKKNTWSNKTIYLTFDDGPSSLTIKVLDLLKKENIKATFFTIGTKTDKGKDILKKILDEGHSLGNHTYSHNYNYIYKSVDNFFEDLYKNENIIYEASGKRPKIIRFPGGSSNATTKTKSGKKVLNEILERLQKEGYIHFDWNASSGDANISPASVDDIVNSTLTWVSKYNSAVVLFHDTATKTNTLEALPIIIEKLKFLGCNFDILTTSSPQIAFAKNKESNRVVPTFTYTITDDSDLSPIKNTIKEKKPPNIIKKFVRLRMEMEKRFVLN